MEVVRASEKLCSCCLKGVLSATRTHVLVCTKCDGGHALVNVLRAQIEREQGRNEQ